MIVRCPCAFCVELGEHYLDSYCEACFARCMHTEGMLGYTLAMGRLICWTEHRRRSALAEFGLHYTATDTDLFRARHAIEEYERLDALYAQHADETMEEIRCALNE
jgi:hypothetical protein